MAVKLSSLYLHGEWTLSDDYDGGDSGGVGRCGSISISQNASAHVFVDLNQDLSKIG